MKLKTIAQETLEILKNAKYITESGETVEFGLELQTAVDETRLYEPNTLNELLQSNRSLEGKEPIIEVTDETTQIAAHRLVVEQGAKGLVLLNYASARNPGGGFINGAKAQEEDLARCSGLYTCLLQQPKYYEENRQNPSLLYSDHMIYSPKVPWFKVRSTGPLQQLFLASVITAPAPNAGQALRRDQNSGLSIESTLRRRAGMVLAIARENKHRNLLLGAWGCGVFKNDPNMVADAFGVWLESPAFQGCFDRVVFAVYDPTKEKGIYAAFNSRFSEAPLDKSSGTDIKTKEYF